jgi:uncharacterized delta-60 repeat protein
VQPDDRIVLAGSASVAPGYDIGLARLNPDGTLDASFGSGGIVVTPLPTQQAAALAIQSDGKLVVAGEASNNLLVARYNTADGSLDTAFGNNGVAATSGVTVLPHKVGAALEPDGRIVVAGTQDHSFGFAVARFLAAGPQIGSFTASPNPVSAGSDLTLTAGNITDPNPGATITQVAFYLDANGDGVLTAADTLLGYGTRNPEGTWAFTFSTAGWAPGSYTLFAEAQDSCGAWGSPAATTVGLV